MSYQPGRGLFIETLSDHPCWTCEHWSGTAICDGAHTYCAHPKYGGVIGRPRDGCSSWTLAIGLDGLDAETCDWLARKYAQPTVYTQPNVSGKRRQQR